MIAKMVIAILDQRLDANKKIDELKATMEKHITKPGMESSTIQLLQNLFEIHMLIATDDLIFCSRLQLILLKREGGTLKKSYQPPFTTSLL